MSIAIKIRRGEGWHWKAAKGLARGLLGLHLPVPPASRSLFRALHGLHRAAGEAAGWAIRFGWYEPLFRGLCDEVGPGFRMERLPFVTGRGRIVVGRDVRLSGKSEFGFSNRLADEPELRLGDGTFVGHDCRFSVSRSVRIGRHCLLAGGVKIFDGDGHPTDARRRRLGLPTPPENARPVVVGDDVWVGSGAIILKGVTIGDRSIVGAGAVVTRDVPPDVIVAGNPARTVKTLDSRARA